MLFKPFSFCRLISRTFLIIILISCEQFPQNISKSELDPLFDIFVSRRTKDKNELKRALAEENKGNGRIPAEKCGFSLNAAVHANYRSFSTSQQQVIKKLTMRPEKQQSIVTPSGRFRIHFNTTGYETPCYDPSVSTIENVRQVAAAFDSSYRFEVNFMGFPPPPEDGGMGGDDLYDVYIESRSNGDYGETVTDLDNTQAKITSYIIIDNDFLGSNFSTHSFEAASVTAAHELHHAIQMGNYGFRWEDRFFHELTSTALEDLVFGDVNDYYKGPYIKKYFASPSRNFFLSEGHLDINGYCIGIWDIFLKEKYGYGIIKRQWELYVNNPAVEAIHKSLLEKSSSFRNELSDFGIWTYFTGYRAISNKYFTDAAHYPVINYMQDLDYSPNLFPLSLSVKPLTNLFLGIKLKAADRTDTVVVKITDGDVNRALSNPYSEVQLNYDLQQGQKDGYRKVVNNLYSKLSSAIPDYLLETDFFNDIITDGGSIAYTELDYAYPNPYSYDKDFPMVPICIPVSYNDLRQAEIRIYSISMDLVYSANAEIFDDKYARRYFLRWNGLDTEGRRLPTGVYLYVTSSNQEIKKGKLLIKN